MTPEETMATFILQFVWLFGGAAFLHKKHSGDKKVSFGDMLLLWAGVSVFLLLIFFAAYTIIKHFLR